MTDTAVPSRAPQEAAVTIERQGHVLLIGLNRLEKRNAFNVAVIEQLAAAYYELEHDEAPRSSEFVVFDYASRYQQTITEMAAVLDRFRLDDKAAPRFGAAPTG